MDANLKQAAGEDFISISIRKGKVKEGEAGDGSKTTGRKTRGGQRITGQAIPFFRGREPGNALPAPCAGLASVAAPEPGHTSTRRPSWPAFGIVGANLLDSVRPEEGMSTRFERIFCPAAFALPVARDTVDDARVGN
jgi:hypothetical protein